MIVKTMRPTYPCLVVEKNDLTKRCKGSIVYMQDGLHKNERGFTNGEHQNDRNVLGKLY